jgi:antitoxin MazE
MELIVRKWGNSLGIRLPRTVTNSLKIQDGATLDLKLIDDTISIKKNDNSLNLKDLLSKINKENLHEEYNFGDSVGLEE